MVSFLCLMLASGFFTLLERKFLSAAQIRKGPDLVGMLGLLQPMADGFKLLMKKKHMSAVTSKFMYLLASTITMIMAATIFSLAPKLMETSLHSNTIVLVLILSTLSTYGLYLCGMAGNSIYSKLGSFRSISMMLSYDVNLLLSFITMGIFFFSQEVSGCKTHFLGAIFFFYFCMMALVVLIETNRSPFDLAEAESELVGGYNVEYGGLAFVMLFLGEYMSIILYSYLVSLLFFYNNIAIFAVSTLLMMYIFLVTRATLPRLRYDSVMMFSWCLLLPVNISFLSLISIL